jgi:quinohemoprotein ethanol dehydrogenase
VSYSGVSPSDKPEENDTPALKMAAKTWSGDTLAKHGDGGHSWNEMTYNPASNLLYFGISGAYPYRHAERSPLGGDNLFLSSIVAVDADTGAYRWHYQTVDKDSRDYNATMNIVLADLMIQDEPRETLLIAPKNGFHYTLDRHTGELLTVGKFAKTNWATDIDLETGKPVYDQAGEFWNFPEGEKGYIWPNVWGAHGWNPMAFHPRQALSYIPVIDAPTERSSDRSGEGIVMLTEFDGKLHAPGKLVAMDPTNGRIRWSVDRDLPFNGGLLTTGGDLVFQGTAAGRFEAFAAGAGERLWSVQTGSAINSTSASYSIDGVQ